MIKISSHGRAAAKNIQNVANGGAARRSDDSDSARKSWQRAFSRRFEQSFGFEFAFERLELCLQHAEAERLNDLNAELVLSARFENRNIAVNLHLRAVGERLPKGRHGVPKNHAGDLARADL